MNKESLLRVFDELNKSNCTWALGGSMILKYFGIDVEPKDIDILFLAKDREKIKRTMNRLGKIIDIPSKGNYRTKEFFRYNVNGIVFEFLGDFKIQWDDWRVYEFILDDKAIIEGNLYDDMKVKITTLEDWYVAYTIMKDPKGRVKLIEEYFKKHGIEHKELLQRNLTQNLPKDVTIKINKLINTISY